MTPIRTHALAVLALALPTTVAAQDKLQIRATALVLADGSTLENGVVVLEGTRISAVGADLAIDEGQPFLEHDGYVSAGLVACQTRSGAGSESRDRTRSVMPAARLVHAFDGEHSDFTRALQAGITSVVLTPAPDNLAGGVTAVLRTGGDDDRVLAREGHLSLSFANAALGHPGLGAATAGQPEKTGQARRGAREPTSYPGALRILRERFARDTADTADDALFQRAGRGELPVLLEAWHRHEVVRAARFAGEHDLVGAIRGAPLAGEPDVLAELVESGLGVVLGPFESGHRTRSLDAVQALHAAGVPVAFALDAPDHNPEGFRLGASLAVSAGAQVEAVMRSLTSEAATIAGVGDRVGALEAGREADLVLWSGHPLDLASSVQAVYVAGERVYAASGSEGGRR